MKRQSNSSGHFIATLNALILLFLLYPCICILFCSFCVWLYFPFLLFQHVLPFCFLIAHITVACCFFSAVVWPSQQAILTLPDSPSLQSWVPGSQFGKIYNIIYILHPIAAAFYCRHIYLCPVTQFLLSPFKVTTVFCYEPLKWLLPLPTSAPTIKWNKLW